MSFRNIEAYVDGMFIKLVEQTDHITDLQGIFDVPKRYQILNSQKCVFGITTGKFLGFMVTDRDIEANPDKIQAIINMKSPTTLHDIQKLNSHLATLSRFLARGAENSLPFTKLLRGVSWAKEMTKKHVMEWTTHYEEAFNQLKQYLIKLPLLTRPRP